MEQIFEFFRSEFCWIYRICRELFAVVLKMKITKMTITTDSVDSIEFNSEKLNYGIIK